MNDEDLRYDMKKIQTSKGKIIINHQFFSSTITQTITQTKPKQTF